MKPRSARFPLTAAAIAISAAMASCGTKYDTSLGARPAAGGSGGVTGVAGGSDATGGSGGSGATGGSDATGGSGATGGMNQGGSGGGEAGSAGAGGTGECGIGSTGCASGKGVCSGTQCVGPWYFTNDLEGWTGLELFWHPEGADEPGAVGMPFERLEEELRARFEYLFPAPVSLEQRTLRAFLRLSPPVETVQVKLVVVSRPPGAAPQTTSLELTIVIAGGDSASWHPLQFPFDGMGISDPTQISSIAILLTASPSAEAEVAFLDAVEIAL
jgi:hypothetical protein